MTVIDAVSSALLDYAVISDPYPLYAAVDSTTPPTTLTVTVSNGGGSTVYCREILFHLPIGDYAQSLLRERSGHGRETTDTWTVTRLTDDVHTALPAGDYAKFRAVPKSEIVPIDETGVTFVLTDLSISRFPGTARIEIRETSTVDQGNWPESPRFTSHKIPKFPTPELPANVVRDFYAKPRSGAVEGAPDVACGQEVTLHWRGPSTLAYKVLAGSGAEEVETEPGGPLTYKLRRDTTFVLTYTIGNSTYHLSTTATVKNPEFTGLTSTGEIRAREGIDAGGKEITARTLRAYRLDPPLSLEGESAGFDLEKGVLTTGTFTCEKKATFKKEVDAEGGLTVDGTGVFKGLVTAAADLTVSQGGVTKLTTSDFDGVKAPRNLRVDGTVTLFTLFHPPFSVDLKWLGPAETDGFLYIQTVEGQSGSILVNGWGEGARIGFNEWSSYTVPIRKGDTWSYSNGTAVHFIKWFHCKNSG